MREWVQNISKVLSTTDGVYRACVRKMRVKKSDFSSVFASSKMANFRHHIGRSRLLLEKR